VHYPPGAGSTLPIEKETFSIGRRPDNDLVIAEKDISRLQAVICREDGLWVMEDRGSTYGTDVNGIPAAGQRLRNRDVISMGRQRQIEMVFLHDDRMSQILEEVDALPRRDSTPGDYRNLSILLRLSSGLNSMTSLQDMLELTLDAIVDVTGADRGFLALRDEDGEIRMRAARNPARESLDTGKQRLSQSIVREVIDLGEPRFLTDVAESQEARRRPSLAELSLSSVICLPLKMLPSERVTRPSRFPGMTDVIGVIYADASHATRPISEITKELITSIATQATLAVENFFLRQEDLERRLIERDMEKEVERLREIDRLKTEFLSNVSHELRTPLTAIKGSIDNILDGVTGDINERQKRYLERINENTIQLDRLISDLLDLERIESGAVRLSRRCISVTRLLEDVAESMRPLAERRGALLKVEPPGEEITVEADRDRLVQVMFNLAGNALKFTGSGGSVTLAARRGDEEVVVWVADTGPGIPQGDLERIFDRFYQVPGPEGLKTSGTGLGLPIARSLVELHGGRLWAESSASGCRFLFTIPLGVS
jgi:signal transduction histidine kinase